LKSGLRLSDIIRDEQLKDMSSKEKEEHDKMAKDFFVIHNKDQVNYNTSKKKNEYDIPFEEL
jgi:hypothetical protein